MTPDQARDLIEAAVSPDDLFPGEAGTAAVYRRLAALVHPDRHPGSPRMAAAFARLGLFRDQRDGRAVALPALLARGDIADLFASGARVLKMPRDPADNDLMAREATALRTLRRGPERSWPFVPELAGTTRQRDPATGIVRRVSTLARLDGFVTLADVADAFPAGISGRDAAWMWRRLLAILGYAHQAGITHGAVLPPHVMIHPAEHGLVLLDWCYSVQGDDTRIPAIAARYRDWYPPEVTARQPAGPWTDIAMAATVMTRLMAGRAPRQLVTFAAGCTLSRPDRRPQDAWRLLAEFDDLLERLYGPRTFHPFTMPDPAGVPAGG